MKIPTIGGIKILFIIIILGAVLGSTAPFVHILYPKTAPEVIELNKSYDRGNISKELYLTKKKELKKKYSYFGFSNKRRFLFSMGLPIALFACSLILLYISKFVHDQSVNKGSIIAGLTFQFTSIYFIIWTLWAYTYEEKDFSKSMYYSVIVLSSVFITIAIFQFQKSILNHNLKIRELIGFIVGARKRFFSVVDKHEPKSDADKEKEQFDKNMYDTLEKIVD